MRILTSLVFRTLVDGVCTTLALGTAFIFSATLIVGGSTYLAIQAATIAGLSAPIIAQVTVATVFVSGVGFTYLCYRNAVNISSYIIERTENILEFIRNSLPQPKPVVSTLFKVRDVMEVHLTQKAREGSAVFSPQFLVSNNFYVQSTSGYSEETQIPFTSEQKPLYSVLVIMDEGKKVQIMAMDQNDSIFFHRKLKGDKGEGVGRTRKVGIFDLANNKMLVQGKNRFTQEELHNPELTKLLAQAKFLNGSTDYTDEELAQFLPHLRTVKREGVQTLFNKHILTHHPKSRRALKNKRNEQTKKLYSLLSP